MRSCYIYATVLVRCVGFLSTYIVCLRYVNFYLAATVATITSVNQEKEKMESEFDVDIQSLRGGFHLAISYK